MLPASYDGERAGSAPPPHHSPVTDHGEAELKLLENITYPYAHSLASHKSPEKGSISPFPLHCQHIFVIARVSQWPYVSADLLCTSLCLSLCHSSLFCAGHAGTLPELKNMDVAGKVLCTYVTTTLFGTAQRGWGSRAEVPVGIEDQE